MLTEERGVSQKIGKEWRASLESTVSEKSQVWEEGEVTLVRSSRRRSRMRNAKHPLDLWGRKSRGNAVEPFQ